MFVNNYSLDKAFRRSMDALLQESLVALSLADALKNLQRESFITKDTANKIYANGLEALAHNMATHPSRRQFECRGTLRTYRNHRKTWTVWAETPQVTSLPHHPPMMANASYATPQQQAQAAELLRKRARPTSLDTREGIKIVLIGGGT